MKSRRAWGWHFSPTCSGPSWPTTGWVSITRPWHLVSKNTGLGDPRSATAEKGRKLMDILTERIGRFLIELAKAPMDETFPY